MNPFREIDRLFIDLIKKKKKKRKKKRKDANM
jgi:hypothetical protein